MSTPRRSSGSASSVVGSVATEATAPPPVDEGDAIRALRDAVSDPVRFGTLAAEAEQALPDAPALVRRALRRALDDVSPATITDLLKTRPHPRDDAPRRELVVAAFRTGDLETLSRLCAEPAIVPAAEIAQFFRSMATSDPTSGATALLFGRACDDPDVVHSLSVSFRRAGRNEERIALRRHLDGLIDDTASAFTADEVDLGTMSDTDVTLLTHLHAWVDPGLAFEPWARRAAAAMTFRKQLTFRRGGDGFSLPASDDELLPADLSVLERVAAEGRGGLISATHAGVMAGNARHLRTPESPKSPLPLSNRETAGSSLRPRGQAFAERPSVEACS